MERYEEQKRASERNSFNIDERQQDHRTNQPHKTLTNRNVDMNKSTNFQKNMHGSQFTSSPTKSMSSKGNTFSQSQKRTVTKKLDQNLATASQQQKPKNGTTGAQEAKKVVIPRYNQTSGLPGARPQAGTVEQNKSKTTLKRTEIKAVMGSRYCHK